MTPEQVQQLIVAHFKEATVNVSGGEGKFETVVVSTDFRGMDTLSRHQLVYAAVNREIATGALHALSIRAYTPEEADARASGR